jgi:2-iminobutanoate/2-iminopropanoate deaminase
MEIVSGGIEEQTVGHPSLIFFAWLKS